MKTTYSIKDGFDIKVHIKHYERDLARLIFNSVKTTWHAFDDLEYDSNVKSEAYKKIRPLIFGVLDRQLNPALLELGTVQLEIEGMTRVGMAQITRQRSATFNVSSQCTKQEHLTFVRPLNYNANPVLKANFEALVNDSVELYNSLLETGMPFQDARYVLPQCVECGKISWNTTANQIANISAFRLCNTCSPDENNLVLRTYRAKFGKLILDDYLAGKIDQLTYEIYLKILDRTDALGANEDTFKSFNSPIKNSGRFSKEGKLPDSIIALRELLQDEFNVFDFNTTYFFKELCTGNYYLLDGEYNMLYEHSKYIEDIEGE